MTTPQEDEPWVGRARLSPPVDPFQTSEQPVVAPGQVVFVEVARPRRRLLFGFGLLAAGIAVGATVALIANPALRDAIGMSSPPQSPSPAESPSPSPSPSPTPSPTEPPAPGVGDPVQDGAFEFVVNDVTCGLETVEWGFAAETADGQYCVVTVSVENIGDLPAFFSDTAQFVLMTDGSRQNADSTAGILANQGFDIWFSVVGPGSTATGRLVFDLPATATLSAIELHKSRLSDGVIVTVPPGDIATGDIPDATDADFAVGQCVQEEEGGGGDVTLVDCSVEGAYRIVAAVDDRSECDPDQPVLEMTDSTGATSYRCLAPATDG